MANENATAPEQPPIGELWRRIEAWLEAHSPKARQDLLPPATPAVIQKLEEFLGAALPEDFRESMLIHDGQRENLEFFDDRWLLLASPRIVERWKLNTRVFRERGSDTAAQPEGPVRGVWWDLLWVPIGKDGSGNDLCLDLDPPEDGHRGQLIEYVHDWDVRPFVAPSFRAWLSRYTDELEGGRYEIDDFSGYPVRKD